MAKTGLLIGSNPSRIFKLLPKIQKEVLNTFYIQYLPESKLTTLLKHQNLPGNLGDVSSHPIVEKYYRNTLSIKHLKVRVLLASFSDPLYFSKIITKTPIDIMYFDRVLNPDEIKMVENFVLNKSASFKCVPFDDSNVSAPSSNEESKSASELDVNASVKTFYDSVVLGGTFDRLHHGHKILLSEAVLRCCKKLTVGVTDVPMLKSKKLWELIESTEIRIHKVSNFLEDVSPHIQFDITPITDMYGPTKDDPTFQMLVVSAETARGGDKINEIREKNGLNKLDVYYVPLLENDDFYFEEEESKVSSSNIRIRLLGTLLKPPEARPNLPARPYIIGLTGGIASGKSSIGQKLIKLGAGYVNCDILAHQLYEVGKPAYKSIVETFGDAILNEDKSINRQALGKIVFSNEIELNRLNSILWPAILEEAKKEAMKLYKENKTEVVVMEAAVLIRAGWKTEVHEVWTSIIPSEEAVKRMMERYQSSREDVLKRLESQPTNSDYVDSANIVFCTLWSPKFTQTQVETAWNDLQNRLKS